MTDIILYDIAHKPSGKENTDYRIDQIKVVGLCRIKIICEKVLYRMNEELQDQCSNSCKNTYQKT